MNDIAAKKNLHALTIGDSRRKGRVLSVAGSDSGGGAGIQADVKAITVNGAYAATAITAITVQNTAGVFSVSPVSPDDVTAQMNAVLKDIGADVIKVGMVGDAQTIHAVACEYNAACIYCDSPPLLVVDPVMFAKSGDALLAPEALETLKTELLPLAHLITPNLPEAEALLGHPVEISVTGVSQSAGALAKQFNAGVLLKGGHAKIARIRDVLICNEHTDIFVSSRIESDHTHGTGCTLSSSIAAHLACGCGLTAAVEKARNYVRQSILDAPGLGNGAGPLGHNGPLKRVRPPPVVEIIAEEETAPPIAEPVREPYNDGRVARH